MPPHKRSKKNIPAETYQEEPHHVEGNEISLAPEPSNITDQERRAKLEALLKARAEKTTHIQEQPTEQQTHETDDDDEEETIDKELERVQQKIQQLQKKKTSLRANCKQKERPLKS
jgi:phage shock protein A